MSAVGARAKRDRSTRTSTRPMASSKWEFIRGGLLTYLYWLVMYIPAIAVSGVLRAAAFAALSSNGMTGSYTTPGRGTHLLAHADVRLAIGAVTPVLTVIVVSGPSIDWGRLSLPAIMGYYWPYSVGFGVTAAAAALLGWLTTSRLALQRDRAGASWTDHEEIARRSSPA